MKNEKVLNTIEEAIEDFRQGKIVIVVDDEDRENEGDFIIAAEKVTPEIVNFMLKNGRGVLCAPLSEERCAQLELNMMEPNNTSLLGTPFTVTVDLLGEGCTTGVSIHDRAATLRALADPKTKPSDLGRPGHINPLRARQKGVLRRPGHTEAAVDLARLAGLQPAGALIEIMNEDGSMARLPQLLEVAEKYGLKIISIADLIAYRLRNESIVERGETAEMPTEYGMFKITVFRQKSNGLEHMVLTKGEWTEDEPVLLRVHSSCATGDILGSCRCDCGAQLHEAMRMIEKEGKGAVVYLSQEGRGIGLFNKIAAYKLQDEGLDTVDANVRLGFGVDERDYGVGASIIREMGIKHMRLMTNNPLKRVGLEGYGLKIYEIVPIVIAPNKYNERYLEWNRRTAGSEFPDSNISTKMNAKDLRIVFMGTPEFAVPSLRALVRSGYNVVGVVTTPDKPAGRGQKLHESDVKIAARELGLPILQPEKLRDPAFVSTMEELRPDLGIVIAFRMLPEVVWAMPRLGTFNLHASLLPQYRGAAPINWAIINGESKTGVTTFLLNHEIDKGAILGQVEMPIQPEDNVGTLYDRLMTVGADLVVQTVERIAAGEITPVVQSDEDTSLRPAPKIFKNDCLIDWTQSGKRIIDFIRGLSPYPAAWTRLLREEQEANSAKIFEARFEAGGPEAPCGTIDTDNRKYLRIRCADGWIDVLSLQLSGKKRMAAQELLLGFRDANSYVCR